MLTLPADIILTRCLNLNMTLLNTLTCFDTSFNTNTHLFMLYV